MPVGAGRMPPYGAELLLRIYHKVPMNKKVLQNSVFILGVQQTKRYPSTILPHKINVRCTPSSFNKDTPNGEALYPLHPGNTHDKHSRARGAKDERRPLPWGFLFERSSIKSPGLYDRTKKPLKIERTRISFKPKKE